MKTIIPKEVHKAIGKEYEITRIGEVDGKEVYEGHIKGENTGFPVVALYSNSSVETYRGFLAVDIINTLQVK